MSIKQTLIDNQIKQSTLATHLGVSPATVNLIVNHNQYPKNPPKSVLVPAINQFFTDRGIKFTHTSTIKSKSSTTTEKEDELMLLRKQTLSQSAKKAFGLFTNPFTSDITSASQLYKSDAVTYVRESMHHTAKHGGFIAITGESGAGKSTLRRDLIDRLNRDNPNIIVIQPYVIATEDNDIKGKTLKAGHIAESILGALQPLTKPYRSPEARFRQVHNALMNSYDAGNRHVLIIEEAHSLPLPTLKHLKRFFELESGYDKLLGIILIGQNELSSKLSEQYPSIREVVQRCEIVTLDPIAPAQLTNYLQHRLGDKKSINTIIDDRGIQAIIQRLTRYNQEGELTHSLLYPLAIGNLLTGAMNEATSLGLPTITAELINEV